MVGIVAWRNQAKIPNAGPNEPDMPPKRIIKGTISYLPYSNSASWHDNKALQVSIVSYQDSGNDFWFVYCEFGYSYVLEPVVQRLDNALLRINRYPLD